MKSFFCSFLLSSLLLFALFGCRQRDIRTAVINVPQAITEQDHTNIKNALGKAELDGVMYHTIKFSTNAPHTVSVQYDSMKIGLKNIEHAIMNAGYDANDFIGK